ncbi:MAG TPA: helix-turn-helix transcriptional regulator [Bdellovibrionota bacterium]|nr:helix-turn-helix transcriptional regulator [Bdellovibrionota bacterium]
MSIGKKTELAVKGHFKRAATRVILTSGEILRIIREKNELTQSDLAKRSGLTQATISSMESNRINIGVERAKALAHALHIHPAVILFPDWEILDKAA